MLNVVFSWRCKCGIRIKVIGETQKRNPTATSLVKCPRCNDEQTVTASNIISVVQDTDETMRSKG